MLKVKAILQHETPPSAENFEVLNIQVFEEQRERPWSAILSESERAYTELVTLTEHLTEEDLTAFNRFAWIPNGEPLYTSFMGNCYEHAQQHWAQYFLDRHDLPHAIHVYESWASRVTDAHVPEILKGMVLYNLACFYATHARLERASALLPQAFTLAPSLKEWSLSDPDLAALRDESTSTGH